MDKSKLKFKIVDILLIIGMLVPLICGIVLKVLFQPASEGIEITGALIYFTIPMPLQDLTITESQVNSWLVIISIFFLCLYFTHGVKVKAELRRQHIAEWIVEKCQSLVHDNMNPYFVNFAPFIGAVMALSVFSSLLSLLGLFPPTSDINVTAGWAILVFILITYYKMKGGILNYARSFTDPTPVMLPMNIIGEIATPISMAFRHFGNVLSGTVISTLIAALLQTISSAILGRIPVIGNIPIFQIGLPAVFSVYFDLFSGCLQAFIFAMLTMLNISGGFPEEAYLKRMEKKNKKKQATSAKA
jgi:F-type H+-transporting ATPase subunit a